MRIIVARGSTINPAQPVTERILSTVESLTARGKAELYEQGQDRKIHQIVVPFQNLISPGQLIEVHDLDHGEVWRGKCIACNILVTARGIEQAITLDQPL